MGIDTLLQIKDQILIWIQQWSVNLAVFTDECSFRVNTILILKSDFTPEGWLLLKRQEGCLRSSGEGGEPGTFLRRQSVFLAFS